MSFIDDIKGQNTQLYPIVTIEPPAGTEVYEEDFKNSIFLSTKHVSLQHIHRHNNQESFQANTFHSFAPLLLNAPSIKESVDIDSRKFKISNVNLNISNYEYKGKRFSEILSDKTLINWNISVQFVSPSANIFSTICPIAIFEPQISFYDAYSGNHSGFTVHEEWGTFFYEPYTPISSDLVDSDRLSKMTEMVYQGVIRSLSHDDEIVKISVEDLTEQRSHKDLPQELLPNTDDIPDKYKNKPIPMVYGYVDKSPVVVSKQVSLSVSDDDSFVSTLRADSKELSDFVQSVYTMGVAGTGKKFNISPVYINDGEGYINIKQESTEGNALNFVEVNSNTIQFPTSGDSDFATNGEVTTEIPRKVESVSYALSQGSIYSIYDIGLNILAAGVSTENLLDYAEPGLEGVPAYANAIKYLTTDGDWNTGLAVEGIIGDNYGGAINVRFHLESLPSEYICRTFVAIDVETGNAHGAYWRVDAGGTNHEVNVYSPYGGVMDTGLDTFSGSDLLGGHELTLWGSIGAYDTFSIQIPRHVEYQTLTTETPYGVDLRIKEAHLYHIAYIDNVIKNDFYVNVRGRINIFDDHPDPPAGDMINEEWTAYNVFYYMVYYYDSINVPDLISMQMFMSYLQDGNPFGAETEEINPSPTQQEIDIAVASLMQVASTLMGQLNPPVNQNNFQMPIEGFMENPIDIIYDLVRSELGHNAIDEKDYAIAKAAHKLPDGSDWKFAFTVTDKINSKKLIEEIAKSTKCFPRFKNNGKFGFHAIKDDYNVGDDYAEATLIKRLDVVSYSFKKTKPENINKKIILSYNKDYAQDEYMGKTAPAYTGMNTGDYDENNEQIWTSGYYGIENSKDTILNFESDYIRDESTANALLRFLSHQYANDHLVFKITLPLKYIGLEIGQLVKFRELLGGVVAHGIDYRIIQAPNQDDTYQSYYPLFIVTSVVKKLDSISIECMQLHHLDNMVNFESQEWYDGVLNSQGNFIEGDETGLFYFSDSISYDVPETPTEELFEGEIVSHLDIPPNTSVYFKLHEHEFLTHISNPSDSASLSEVMHPSRFEPSIFESFITDHIGNGIIEIYSAPSPAPYTNENINIATVREGYSTPDNPYYAMRMDFVNPGANNPLEYIEEPGVTKFAKDMANDAGQHDMFMYIDGYTSQTLVYHLHSVVALTNYSSEIIRYTPLQNIEFYGMETGATSGFTAPSIPAFTVLGDLNLDNRISILDVVMLVQHILHGSHADLPLSEQAIANADFNQDGQITVLDIVHLANYLVSN